jgi:hypothetical protein
MFTKTKIALSAVLILGAASAALASDRDDSVSEAQATRETYQNPLPWWWNTPVQGRGSSFKADSAYGYVASPSRQKNLSQSRK